MKTIAVLCFLFVGAPFFSLTQEKDAWILDRCIDYALEHNISIKRQKLVDDTKEIALSENRWTYSPDIYASGSSSMSTGRVLDQTTYELVKNSTVGESSASISGSMNLFNGFRRTFALKRAKLDLQASTVDLESLKYDIQKSVTAAFLSMQCCESDLSSAVETQKLLNAQIERIAILVETGRVKESDLLQAKAQAFAAKNDISTAEGNLAMAQNELCQLLDVEDDGLFSISQDETAPAFLDSIYFSSDVTFKPEYRSAELAVEMAKKDISIAQSAFYPSLSLSAGYGSSSSTARQKSIQNPDGTSAMRHIHSLSSTLTTGAPMSHLGLASLSSSECQHATMSKEQEFL